MGRFTLCVLVMTLAVWLLWDRINRQTASLDRVHVSAATLMVAGIVFNRRLRFSRVEMPIAASLAAHCAAAGADVYPRPRKRSVTLAVFSLLAVSSQEAYAVSV